jgi:hypothetical protein
MTHRQHLKINACCSGKSRKKNRKKNWVVAVTQIHDPPRAHATPPHRDPLRPTSNHPTSHRKPPRHPNKNPARSEKKKKAKTQLGGSPTSRRHAAPHSATPHASSSALVLLVASSAIQAGGALGCSGENPREREQNV